MSESIIDPEDDVLIRGRPRSIQGDEWDEPEDRQFTKRGDNSETPEERDGYPTDVALRFSERFV